MRVVTTDRNRIARLDTLVNLKLLPSRTAARLIVWASYGVCSQYGIPFLGPRKVACGMFTSHSDWAYLYSISKGRDLSRRVHPDSYLCRYGILLLVYLSLAHNSTSRSSESVQNPRLLGAYANLGLDSRKTAPECQH